MIEVQRYEYTRAYIWGGCLEDQHHHLESDAGSDRKPVEVTKEASHLEKCGRIVHEARCSVLDTLQQFRHRGWESIQEGVAVVQAGDDQRLNQELCCAFCEERPDPADVVEGKSAGSGP